MIEGFVRFCVQRSSHPNAYLQEARQTTYLKDVYRNCNLGSQLLYS